MCIIMQKPVKEPKTSAAMNNLWNKLGLVCGTVGKLVL